MSLKLTDLQHPLGTEVLFGLHIEVCDKADVLKRSSFSVTYS